MQWHLIKQRGAVGLRLEVSECMHCVAYWTIALFRASVCVEEIVNAIMMVI